MNNPQKVIYVNYCDAINEIKVKAIMSALSDIINREKPDTIYCLFSSTGGQVEPGIALYNFLRALPVKIIMHNTGSIDSIANIIFLAADTRYASVHSSFLFHGINWNFAANTSLNKSQLTEILSNMRLLKNPLCNIFYSPSVGQAVPVGESLVFTPFLWYHNRQIPTEKEDANDRKT